MYVAREAYWRAQVLAKDLRFFVSAQGRVGIFRCFNSRTLSTIESALSHYRPRR